MRQFLIRASGHAESEQRALRELVREKVVMRKTLLPVAIYLALPGSLALVTTAVSAQQQTATFVCLAPVGHVCQFTVRTGTTPMSFALPSGERNEVAGITPGSDKYCICDPGPVTADCTAPQLNHWCLGFWADVTPGLNPPR
jgi:hypothetical protein